jgi:ABC-type phosphate transport system substrate-binding protein
MPRHLLKLLGLLLFLRFSVASADNSILVITHRDLPAEQMTIKQLKNIFRRKILVNQQGVRWVPLNLSAEHPLRRAFSEKVFEMQPEEMETYWNEQYFQGVMPPYVVNSQEAMLRFIASMPGAIGYIFPCHLDNRVQVIMTLKVSGSVEQTCRTP